MGTSLFNKYMHCTMHLLCSNKRRAKLNEVIYWLETEPQPPPRRPPLSTRGTLAAAAGKASSARHRYTATGGSADEAAPCLGMVATGRIRSSRTRPPCPRGPEIRLGALWALPHPRPSCCPYPAGPTADLACLSCGHGHHSQ